MFGHSGNSTLMHVYWYIIYRHTDFWKFLVLQRLLLGWSSPMTASTWFRHLGTGREQKIDWRMYRLYSAKRKNLNNKCRKHKLKSYLCITRYRFKLLEWMKEWSAEQLQTPEEQMWIFALNELRLWIKSVSELKPSLLWAVRGNEQPNVFADIFLNSQAEMKCWIFNAPMLLSISCIFVWRLAPELTISMRERLWQLQQRPDSPPGATSGLR